jgi:hypothetical protein
MRSPADYRAEQLTLSSSARPELWGADHQPAGTESIGAFYWDDSKALKVAYAHYFWLPPAPGLRWRIGGSGVPHGKMVYWDGVVLYIEE